MRLRIISFVVVAVTFLLAGCSYPNPQFSLEPSPNVNIHQLTTTIYTDDEINELLNSMIMDIDTLNDHYPVECIREVDLSGVQEDYYIYYCGISKYVSIYLRKDGTNWLCYESSYLDARFDLSYFESNLMRGTLLRTIEAVIDPYGLYPFRHGGTGGLWSVHHTSDGYRVVVYYSYKNGPSDAMVDYYEVELI